MVTLLTFTHTWQSALLTFTAIECIDLTSVLPDLVPNTKHTASYSYLGLVIHLRQFHHRPECTRRQLVEHSMKYIKSLLIFNHPLHLDKDNWHHHTDSAIRLSWVVFSCPLKLPKEQSNSGYTENSQIPSINTTNIAFYQYQRNIYADEYRLASTEPWWIKASVYGALMNIG